MVRKGVEEIGNKGDAADPARARRFHPAVLEGKAESGEDRLVDRQRHLGDPVKLRDVTGEVEDEVVVGECPFGEQQWESLDRPAEIGPDVGRAAAERDTDPRHAERARDLAHRPGVDNGVAYRH
jgi:hypothetical protein